MELDQVTQKNAAMVEETSAAGQLLDGDAQRLGSLMKSFEVAADSADDTDVADWETDAEAETQTGTEVNAA